MSHFDTRNISVLVHIDVGVRVGVHIIKKFSSRHSKKKMTKTFEIIKISFLAENCNMLG